MQRRGEGGVAVEAVGVTPEPGSGRIPLAATDGCAIVAESVIEGVALLVPSQTVITFTMSGMPTNSPTAKSSVNR